MADDRPSGGTRTLRRIAAAAVCFALFFPNDGWPQVPETPGEEEKEVAWRSNATLSVSIQQGVSSQRQVSITGEAFRRHPEGQQPAWSYAAQGDYTYASVKLDSTFQAVADSQNLRFTAERELTELLFAVLRPAFKRNEVQGVDYRIEELAGLGVELHEGSFSEIDIIAVSGAVQQEKRVAEADGGSVVVGAVQTSEWGLPREWRVSQMFLYLAPLDDSDDYRLQLQTALVGPITTRLATRISFDLDRENIVAGNSRQADRKFQLGLQWNF